MINMLDKHSSQVTVRICRVVYYAGSLFTMLPCNVLHNHVVASELVTRSVSLIVLPSHNSNLIGI